MLCPSETPRSEMLNKVKSINFSMLKGLLIEEYETWANTQRDLFSMSLSEIINDLYKIERITDHCLSVNILTNLVSVLCSESKGVLEFLEKHLQRTSQHDWTQIRALILVVALDIALHSVDKMKLDRKNPTLMIDTYLNEIFKNSSLRELCNEWLIYNCSSFEVKKNLNLLTKRLSNKNILDLSIIIRLFIENTYNRDQFHQYRKLLNQTSEAELLNIKSGKTKPEYAFGFFTQYLLYFLRQQSIDPFMVIWRQLTDNNKFKTVGYTRLVLMVVPHLMPYLPRMQSEIVLSPSFFTLLIQIRSSNHRLHYRYSRFIEDVNNIPYTYDSGDELLSLLLKQAEKHHSILFLLHPLVKFAIRHSFEDPFMSSIKELLSKETLSSFMSLYYLLKTTRFVPKEYAIEYLVLLYKEHIIYSDDRYLQLYKQSIGLLKQYAGNSLSTFLHSTCSRFLSDVIKLEFVNITNFPLFLQDLKNYTTENTSLDKSVIAMSSILILYNIENRAFIEKTLGDILISYYSKEYDDICGYLIEQIIILSLMPYNGCHKFALDILSIYIENITIFDIEKLTYILAEPTSAIECEYISSSNETKITNDEQLDLGDPGEILDINELNEAQIKMINGIFQEAFSKKNAIKQNDVNRQTDFITNRIYSLLEHILSANFPNAFLMLAFLSLYKLLISPAVDRNKTFNYKYIAVCKILLKKIDPEKTPELFEMNEIYKKFKTCLSCSTAFNNNNLVAAFMHHFLTFTNSFDMSMNRKFKRKFTRFICSFIKKALISKKEFLNQTFFQYMQTKLPYLLENGKILKIFSKNLEKINGSKLKIKISNQIYRSLAKTASNITT